MAKKVNVKWNMRALYKLRSEPGIRADLEKRAEAIADAANKAAKSNGFDNAKYETSSQQGKRNPQGRWRTTVITSNAEAMLDNAANDTLLKNMGEAK